jgi:hypothetical protein
MPKVAGYRALWDLIPRAVQPRMPATAQTRQFKLRGGELDEGQRAVGELGYRYGFFVLAVAATTSSRWPCTYRGTGSWVRPTGCSG